MPAVEGPSHCAGVQQVRVCIASARDDLRSAKLRALGTDWWRVARWAPLAPAMFRNQGLSLFAKSDIDAAKGLFKCSVPCALDTIIRSGTTTALRPVSSWKTSSSTTPDNSNASSGAHWSMLQRTVNAAAGITLPGTSGRPLTSTCAAGPQMWLSATSLHLGGSSSSSKVTNNALSANREKAVEIESSSAADLTGGGEPAGGVWAVLRPRIALRTQNAIPASDRAAADPRIETLRRLLGPCLTGHRRFSSGNLAQALALMPVSRTRRMRTPPRPQPP